MGTARVSDIKQWFKEGKRQKATHMIVVHDSFDHDDYPSYVKPTEHVQDRADYYNVASMQRVVEVYALHVDFNAQLGLDKKPGHRNFNYDYPPNAKVPKRAIEKKKVKGSVVIAGLIRKEISVLSRVLPKSKAHGNDVNTVRIWRKIALQGLLAKIEKKFPAART